MRDAPTDARDVPPRDRFEGYVERAIEALPGWVRERLGSVAIVIEDEPTPAQLAAVRAHGLYGLYQGVPRTAWGAEGASVPSKITIFRGPLERTHGQPERLAAAVEDTIRHEVAHHLGIDDRRLRELQRRR